MGPSLTYDRSLIIPKYLHWPTHSIVPQSLATDHTSSQKWIRSILGPGPQADFKMIGRYLVLFTFTVRILWSNQFLILERFEDVWSYIKSHDSEYQGRVIHEEKKAIILISKILFKYMRSTKGI